MTDLVGLTEIAERLGNPVDTVKKWRHRGLLPEPDWQLAAGPVWEWETIRIWALETGRTE
jgi:hypothetical protein